MTDLSQYDPAINEAARQWGLPPDLLRSVIMQESNGNPLARSKAGALGLTGLMPQTAAGLGVTDPNDPIQQIFGGAKYLAEGRAKEGSIEGGLLYYHGGPDWRKAYGLESQAYVPAIAAHYTAFNVPKAASPGAADPSEMSDEEFLKLAGGKPAPGATPSAVDPSEMSDEDFLKLAGGKPAPADSPATPTQTGGFAHNVGAGLLDASSNVLNVLSDPVGNLVGKPLATAYTFGHDALAPYLGYDRYTDKQRNDLIGDTVPQPGTRLISGIGNALGVDPSAVPANNALERAVRLGVGGGATMAALGPASLGGFMGGAAGAIAGDYAGRSVPEWAAPAASLGANVLTMGGMGAARAGVNALAAGRQEVPLLPNSFVKQPFLAGSPAENIVGNKLIQAQGPAMPVPGATKPPVIEQPIPNGLTPEQIAEFKAIPTALPPMKGEIATKTDAEARADDVVNHFASIGNRAPIPGATGSLPTITGNPGLATLYRAVRDSDTPVPFTALEGAARKENNATLKSMVGDGHDVNARETALETAAKPMYDAVWANKTAADPSVTIQNIKDALKSPDTMQNDMAVLHLNEILDKLQPKQSGPRKSPTDNLVNPSGDPLFPAAEPAPRMETDPAQLHGIIRNINSRLNPLPGATSDGRGAMAELLQVKSDLQNDIEPAAPGFADVQAKYAAMKQPITEMKWLQSRGLTNQMDDTTLGKVSAALEAIRIGQAKDKLSAVDSVSPETIAKLTALKEKMQRENFTATAGKALGSNTFQNLATNSMTGKIAGGLGNNLLGVAAGLGIDLAAGMPGNGVLGAIAGGTAAAGLKSYSAVQAAKMAAQQEAGRTMLMEALRERLLNIDNSGVRALKGGK